MRRCSNEPWWNWSDRWEIAEEYFKGATLSHLSIKYRHDRGQISGWINALGLKREPEPKETVVPKPRKHSKNIEELCRALVYAKEKLGRPPRFDEIDRIMKVVADEGYFASRQSETVTRARYGVRALRVVS